MLMKTQRTWLTLSLCGVCACSFSGLSGCEDSAAQQRTEVQAKLDGAMEQFRHAEFASVVSELSSVSGGEPGQQAARGMLLADSLREMGLQQLSQAREIELEQRRRRLQVRDDLAGLLRLEANAAAMAAASTEPVRAAIHAQQTAAEDEIRQLNRTISELSGPINERRAAIDRDRNEVADLREEADALYRKAMDMGHADGFPSFEQATALRREADQIERQIASVEIELEQDLEPRRDAAVRAIEHAKSAQESAQATLRALDEFDRVYQEQVASLRSKSEELRRRIGESMTAMAAAASNEVEPRYEEAISRFERAVSEASTAARHAERDSAAGPLTEARCHESLGRAHWSRARDLADHAALLSSLVSAGPVLGNGAGYQAQVEATAAAQRERSERARTAYEAALAAVDRGAGRIQGGLGYRESLQIAVNHLSGQDVELSSDDANGFEAIDLEMPEMPFDPSMMENLAQIGGKETLLAMLDQMDFETVKQMIEAAGVADAAMMDQMREPYNKAVAAVRQRVERGEITTAEQLQQALIQEMTQAMMGG